MSGPALPEGRRFALLFYMLLLTLCVPPLLSILGFGGQILEILLALALIAAVPAFRGGLRWLVLVVTVLAVVARPGAAWFGQDDLSIASLALWGLLALLTAASALVYSLRGRSVNAGQVYAALSAYLLGGVFFALLYCVIEYFLPGSFTFAGVVDPGAARVATMVYFSFVTLASLGYGDILPVSDLARGLAIVEVVGGQLYLAVLVARLVSAWR